MRIDVKSVSLDWRDRQLIVKGLRLQEQVAAKTVARKRHFLQHFTYRVRPEHHTQLERAESELAHLQDLLAGFEKLESPQTVVKAVG